MKIANKKGFTLIEVVLVLAIGGLIFLLAFLAFQQVSRNRRDTQRRTDVARVVAELQNYAGDNNGQYPADEAAFNGVFREQYMGGANFRDPGGALYVSSAEQFDASDLPVNAGYFWAWPLEYGLNQRCNGTDFAAQSGSVAVRGRLESGIVCRDNQ